MSSCGRLYSPTLNLWWVETESVNHWSFSQMMLFILIFHHHSLKKSCISLDLIIWLGRLTQPPPQPTNLQLQPSPPTRMLTMAERCTWTAPACSSKQQTIAPTTTWLLWWGHVAHLHLTVTISSCILHQLCEEQQDWAELSRQKKQWVDTVESRGKAEEVMCTWLVCK